MLVNLKKILKIAEEKYCHWFFEYAQFHDQLLDAEEATKENVKKVVAIFTNVYE